MASRARLAPPVVGLGVHPFSPRVPAALGAACERLGVAARPVDLVTLQTSVSADGEVEVRDAAGPVQVSHLAPVLLYWQDAAAVACSALEQRGVRVLNTVAASELADDKARTSVRLSAGRLPQVRTSVLPQDLAACLSAAEREGYPVVLKRAHGAQGRWVRGAAGPAELERAYGELVAEGRGSLLLQPLVHEVAGRSLRLVVVRGRVVACTERSAPAGELQSNVSSGGSQRLRVPTPQEERLAVQATQALGLGFSGVDLLTPSTGPLVLEVNAAPDFTSMLEHVPVDLAQAVLRGLLDGP